MNFVNLNYHYHKEFNTPEPVIALHKFSCGFFDFLKQKVNFTAVKHVNYTGHRTEDGIQYFFFKSMNKFWYVPFKTHSFIKRSKPDVVLVEGFVFPLQVIFLKWRVGKKCVIIVQHQGERPYKGIKKYFQRLCDSFINAYTFSSIDNAGPWIQSGIIANMQKCREVLSASTSMKPLDKEDSKKMLGFDGTKNFLWVARLNTNKDPLTVLKAFNRFLQEHPDARLYMIHQTTDLLNEIISFCNNSTPLKQAVKLIGRIENKELATWYSAADYFISGSHSEGSGYALAEAMACGCIPVVTAIPSFKKMSNNGQFGYLYEPGNADDLLEKMKCCSHAPDGMRQQIMDYAAKEHSFNTIAESFYQISQSLVK